MDWFSFSAGFAAATVLAVLLYRAGQWITRHGGWPL